ncbi:MAG: RNA polymerase sigma factor [candidate division WOR-3 bacterium]
MQRFEDIYKCYYNDVFRFILSKIRNINDALDLTNEVFLRALKGFKRFKGLSSVKTWLFKIAINEMRRYWRDNSYKVSLSDDIEDTDETIFFYEIPEEEDYDEFKPVYPLESFKKAFSQLPEGYQKVLWLFYIEKRTYRQIADELGISIGTVKSRLNRAKVKLKEILENEARGGKG